MTYAPGPATLADVLRSRDPRLSDHAELDGDTGCIIWRRALVPDGYGRTCGVLAALDQHAHRASYLAFKGPIAPRLHVDHLCRNRACVNPDHLEPVTPLENTHRSPISNANKTHCPQGHAYDEENTLVKAGRRRCITCRRAQEAAYARARSPRRRQQARRLWSV